MKRLTSALATTGLVALGVVVFAPQATPHGQTAKEEEQHQSEETAAGAGEDKHETGGMHGEEGHHDSEMHGEEGHHESGEMRAEEEHHELEEMREEHRGHEHQHDFAAMDRLSPEERSRLMNLMREIGLALPPMDPERGRELFLEKGCVACHQVSGVGGDLGPSLDAEDMPEPMNAFEFAARMWRGAAAMTALQEQLLGDVITLDGQELADIIAFAHDEQAQEKLAESQIPERYRDVIGGE